MRFPFFAEIHWYLVKVYVEILERDMDERRKLEFEGINNFYDAEKLYLYFKSDKYRQMIVSGTIIFQSKNFPVDIKVFLFLPSRTGHFGLYFSS